MTLDEARAHVGSLVVYHSHEGAGEQGQITSVNAHFVFVRYGTDTHSKATAAGMLSLVQP
jgi:hypothetical protein